MDAGSAFVSASSSAGICPGEALGRPSPEDLTIDGALERIEALLESDQLDAAETLCSEVGRQCAPALYAAGTLAIARREVDRAVDLFRAAVLLAPNVAEFQLSYARALFQKQDLDRCLEAAKAAVELEPTALSYRLLATTYSRLGQESEAAAALECAIELAPDDAAAWSSLGAARLGSDDLDGAVSALTRAIELNPNFTDAWLGLGRCFGHNGRTREAVAHMRRARELAPDAPHINAALLFALAEAPEPTSEQVFDEHRGWGARRVELLERSGHTCAEHENDPDPDRPLRIGYVSADLRRHPVAFFSAAMLTLYDPKQFKVACYFNGVGADQATWQMRSRVDHWSEITGLPDDAVEQLIRDDGIDILVDLSGYTAGERLGVFARRPAPLQVTYLGYVATTGLPTMDYRITDAYSDPPGETEQFYTEKLVRPFESFVCYAPTVGAPDVAEPPVTKTGHVTFGSYNRGRKINREVAALWARVLRAVPGSRLLLKPGTSCRKPIADLFDELGVGDRVDIEDPHTIMSDYLRAYAAVDIALDTFPWNGITTTCDALFMGVPVIALAGREHRSRAAASLLNNIGLSELIAKDGDDYVARAAALAGDLERLSAIRSGLREKMQTSPVMDGVGFTRGLEKAYREMWQTWCAERAARSPRSG